MSLPRHHFPKVRKFSMKCLASKGQVMENRNLDMFPRPRRRTNKKKKTKNAQAKTSTTEKNITKHKTDYYSFEGSNNPHYEIFRDYYDNYIVYIWVPKTLVTNIRGPIEKWVPKTRT